VGAALEALGSDPDLLAAERARLRVLLVDDAQQLDPQAARLVRVLAAGAELTVIAGDPDQAVFGYRGADPQLLRGDGDGEVVTLTVSHRCASAVTGVITGLARRLPAASAVRHLTGDATRTGTVGVRVAASPHAEAAVIADALRRAHLVDGVPWSQMAVLVRSMPRTGSALARALSAAGVPVDVPRAGAPLADLPAVRALLTVLEATADGLDGAQAAELLTGP
ncbi:UvrD-helicase domain-containing protein, partial [Mycolicibacterium arseniciresistens]